MALPRSFPSEDAEASIQRTGVYTLDDHVVGSRVEEFSRMRFPTKSPLGLEFIAQNSFVRKVWYAASRRQTVGLTTDRTYAKYWNQH